MQNQSAILSALQTITVQNSPLPEVGPNDALVKIEYCGICGSDVHFFEHGCIGSRTVTYPFILGHEVSGEIAAVGSAVTHLFPGQKVVIEPGVPCGHCEFCRKGRYNICPELAFQSSPPYDGLLSRYVSVSSKLIYPLPADVSTLEGALIEPLAVGVYAAQRAEVHSPQTVVILGSGCIGLCTLLACRQRGVSRIIVCDLFQNRLDRAKALGADEVVNASDCDSTQKILELTNSQGADIVFETAGNRYTTSQTTALVRTGGTILVIGNVIGDVPFNFRTLILKEVDVKTVWRYQNVFPACIEMLRSGSIPIESLRSIVDSIFPFEDVQNAFMTAMADKQHIVKAVIHIENKT